MRSNALIVGSLFITAALLVGCSSGGASSSAPAASQAPASVAPASEAPASAEPSAEPSAAAGAVTVDAKPVGAAGTVLVDGKSGLTVYSFTKDVKDSGTSNCTDGCADTWPPLTVAAGATPTGASALTGTLATITRDDGTLQVTYNGKPLYFFKNDKAPGDANGIYQYWEAVKP
jgi:predicted lipoprotein with Yx(FWY)xxD motif